MKLTAENIAAVPMAEKSWAGVFSDLVKARLSFLALLTTLVGFCMGVTGPIDIPRLIATLFGTALLACGAAALNQFIEREHDARMRRTEDRPLPSGRLRPETVLIFGGLCSIIGMACLSLTVNLLTGMLGALTLVSYLFVYTPLKRKTWLNTAVGAIPGALPPLIGWAAARDSLTGEGWSLFAILFFWQIPHFLAIAWLYRDEYAKAGFVMLPGVDPQGHRTGRQAVSHTLGLLLASLWPAIFGLAGIVYLIGAFLLGVLFLIFAVKFARALEVTRARQLFFISIVYLPLLLVLMVLDKVRY